jgi:hypothetical protein
MALASSLSAGRVLPGLLTLSTLLLFRVSLEERELSSLRESSPQNPSLMIATFAVFP